MKHPPRSLIETVGELIEVIHKDLDNLRIEVNELKSRDNIGIRIQLRHIEDRLSKIEVACFG